MRACCKASLPLVRYRHRVLTEKREKREKESQTNLAVCIDFFFFFFCASSSSFAFVFLLVAMSIGACARSPTPFLSCTRENLCPKLLDTFLWTPLRPPSQHTRHRAQTTRTFHQHLIILFAVVVLVSFSLSSLSRPTE